MRYVHASVTYSSAYINQVDGICNNSEQKIKDERIRKTVKKGAKNRLPHKESTEIGSPHAISNGSEMIVIKSCNSTKSVNW